MSLTNLNLDESVKSSEYTGSNEPYKSDIPAVIMESDVNAEKEKIIQLSNDSILHGYDLAIQVLAGHGLVDAVTILGNSRSAIEVSLYQSKVERIKGNVEIGAQSADETDTITE